MRPAGVSSRTLRLDLAYEGTCYSGFGIQPGRLTVQEVLEEALARSLGEQIRVTAAGRTDAGGHASGQVVKPQHATENAVVFSDAASPASKLTQGRKRSWRQRNQVLRPRRNNPTGA